jgi:hypothetical protein
MLLEMMVMAMQEETKEVAPQTVLAIVKSITKTSKIPLLAWRKSSMPSQKQQAPAEETEVQAAMAQMVVEMVDQQVVAMTVVQPVAVTVAQLAAVMEDQLAVVMAAQQVVEMVEQIITSTFISQVTLLKNN